MFARVAIYEVPGGRRDEAVSNFRDALRRLQDQADLDEAFVLVSPEADRVLTLTVWEGQEAMARSTVSASRLRSDAAKASGGSVLSVQEYEVAVHE